MQRASQLVGLRAKNALPQVTQANSFSEYMQVSWQGARNSAVTPW